MGPSILQNDTWLRVLCTSLLLWQGCLCLVRNSLTALNGSSLLCSCQLHLSLWCCFLGAAGLAVLDCSRRHSLVIRCVIQLGHLPAVLPTAQLRLKVPGLQLL